MTDISWGTATLPTANFIVTSFHSVHNSIVDHSLVPRPLPPEEWPGNEAMGPYAVHVVLAVMVCSVSSELHS